MVLNYKSHGYVIAVDNKKNKITVADGTNNYKKDQEVRNTISNMFPNKEIINLQYNNDTGNDHCASAAALIGIEFRRYMAKDKWPENISVGNWLKNKIVKIMHKHSTIRVIQAKNIKTNNNIKRKSCSKCAKVFKNYRSMRTHQLNCN